MLVHETNFLPYVSGKKKHQTPRILQKFFTVYRLHETHAFIRY